MKNLMNTLILVPKIMLFCRNLKVRFSKYVFFYFEILKMANYLIISLLLYSINNQILNDSINEIDNNW